MHTYSFTVNQGNHQKFDPSLLHYKFWMIFMGMKQKKKFEKKKFKMADSKKLSFSTSPKAEQFPPKFHGLVLGLVGLIDAKGNDVAQPIWPWGCPTWAQKWPKNTKNAFFACFWAHVGQPHGHIGWATSLPFASINPTNPRTNPWNFGRNCSAFGDVEKLSFFESAILNFFFQKKKKNLLYPHENKSQIMC